MDRKKEEACFSRPRAQLHGLELPDFHCFVNDDKK
jgi:hypothetical protein